MTTKATVLDVEGMSCSSCVRHVENALKALPGVEKFDVKIGKVRVEHDESKASSQQIIDAITEAGYDAHTTA